GRGRSSAWAGDGRAPETGVGAESREAPCGEVQGGESGAVGRAAGGRKLTRLRPSDARAPATLSRRDDSKEDVPARRGGRAGTWKEGRWEDAGLGQAPGERPPTVAQHVRRRGGVERSDRVRGLERVMSGEE